jgi:hypothetical protein
VSAAELMSWDPELSKVIAPPSSATVA